MIVMGLGNPGEEYRDTRHNAGFMVLEAACRRWRSGDWRRHGPYLENQIQLAGRSHRLIQPMTYMNCSGEAVEKLVAAGACAADLFVVLDDVDLPLGRMRIRPSGGPGGHNGLQSILDVLSPQSVARMRFGVGRPEGVGQMVDHVLGEFSPEEGEQFEQMLARALDALHVILKQGITPAMNRFNGLPAPWAPPEEPAE